MDMFFSANTVPNQIQADKEKAATPVASRNCSQISMVEAAGIEPAS